MLTAGKIPRLWRAEGDSIATVNAGLEGEKAYWWRSAAVGRDGALGLLPNWVGGHMSVRPLPYLEGRCKNRPTCHRRAMTGLSWSHFFCCAVQELSLTDRCSSGPKSTPQLAPGASGASTAARPQRSGFKTSVSASIRPADVSLSKTPSPPELHCKAV